MNEINFTKVIGSKSIKPSETINFNAKIQFNNPNYKLSRRQKNFFFHDKRPLNFLNNLQL